MADYASDPRERERQLDEERRKDLGFLLTLFGIFSMGIAWGRWTSPTAGCQEKLLQRDTELILCENRLGNLGVVPPGAP